MSINNSEVELHYEAERSCKIQICTSQFRINCVFDECNQERIFGLMKFKDS